MKTHETPKNTPKLHTVANLSTLDCYGLNIGNLTQCLKNQGILLMASVCLGMGTAYAQTAHLQNTIAQTPSYNQISFSTEVHDTVKNDELIITLSKSAQASTPKSVSSSLNTALNRAINRTKEYADVTVVRQYQHTNPRYNNQNKIVGYTGTAILTLKSQNFAVMSELAGELSRDFAIDGMVFGVSDATQATAKDALSKKAIQAFLNDAQSITGSFGATSYRIVKVQLDQQNHHHYHPMPVSEMVQDASKSLPTTAGDSRMDYRISGTIELIK